MCLNSSPVGRNGPGRQAQVERGVKVQYSRVETPRAGEVEPGQEPWLFGGRLGEPAGNEAYLPASLPT